MVAVSASDSDEGSNGKVAYHFSQENSNFVINETTGAIYITSPLTYHLYVLNITAVDGGEDPRSSSVLVIIHASIYQTLQIANSIITVREDVPIASLIGNISYAVLDNYNATLNDTSGTTVAFEILNGSATDLFAINATTGEIFTLGTLDYETLATEYDLVVRATLFAPTHEIVDEAVVRIAVENVDDTPPWFSMLTYAITVEQFTMLNASILTVSAIDLDALNNTKYSLMGGNSSSFGINSVTGEILASVLLDTPQDYSFTVVATDAGTGEANASVFISVTQSPIFFAQDFSFSLSESAVQGTVVNRVADGFVGNWISYHHT